jgi:serine/threonine protein kinase
MTSGWPVVVPEGYVVSRWRVGAPIGAGSWGSVYEARLAAGTGQAPWPERAAVKFLPTGTVTQRRLAHLADMARREQEVHRRLRHPRLIRLIEAVVVDDPDHPELDGSVALVTERAMESLADVIARAAGKPAGGAPRILTEICEGIAHMHAAGWVHGDLKPGNVLVMADGSVRLADFGLSAELDGTHGYLPPAGSCDYVPPERWNEPLTGRGIAVRESADIWALGVIGCLLLTGHLPFPGPTARARAAAAAGYAASGIPAPAIDGPVPQWRQLIADCLAPDHSRRRHLTAARLLSRLRRLQGAGVPPAPRRRRRLITALAAVTIVAAASTGGAALWAARGPAPGYSRYFRPGSGVPAQYQALIVAAGTMCAAPGVSPALVAAILRAQSGFNPRLYDPAASSYGIAGWTPGILWYYQDPPAAAPSARYALNPRIAIPAVGRYLCHMAPALASVPGDHAVNLAAAYQTAEDEVAQDHGVPPRIRAYAARVRQYLRQYQPPGG